MNMGQVRSAVSVNHADRSRWTHGDSQIDDDRRISAKEVIENALNRNEGVAVVREQGEHPGEGKVRHWRDAIVYQADERF
jgi:hypothetical protein